MSVFFTHDVPLLMCINAFQVSGRWEMLRDNVRQFIMEEAATESYLGVVMFGSEIKASTMLPLNNNGNRGNLTNFIQESSPDIDNGSKDLGAAIERGVQVRVSCSM